MRRSGVDNMSFNKHKRNLQKTRAKLLPSSPSTSTEVTQAFQNEFVMKNYGTTKRTGPQECTPFFKIAAEENGHSYCIFASDDIAKLVRENIEVTSRKFIADATFDVTPMRCVYTQFLIVQTCINGQVNKTYR